MEYIRQYNVSTVEKFKNKHVLQRNEKIVMTILIFIYFFFVNLFCIAIFCDCIEFVVFFAKKKTKPIINLILRASL